MRDIAVVCCLMIGLVSLAIDVARLEAVQARLEAAQTQATIYSADNCAPCVRYVNAVKAELPKRGLIVRDDTAQDASTADVVVTKQPAAGVDSFPTTIIRRNGREVRRITGEITPTKLIEALGN